MKAIFDTNILIDYLNGVESAKAEYEYFNEKYISVITYTEVLVKITDPTELKKIQSFLRTFSIIDVSTEIADLAVALRQKAKLKLPDALILASAEKIGGLLVTRDTKGFSETWPIVRVPYQL